MALDLKKIFSPEELGLIAQHYAAQEKRPANTACRRTTDPMPAQGAGVASSRCVGP